jgi:hypothetical protein
MNTNRVLNDAQSGNTVRAHLIEVLGDGDQALEQLEEQLNQTMQAQLPQRVRRKLRSRACEAARDWGDIPYHGQDGKQNKNVRPNQPRAGTTRFHAYATPSVISKGKRVTLAMTIAHKGEKRSAPPIIAASRSRADTDNCIKCARAPDRDTPDCGCC